VLKLSLEQRAEFKRRMSALLDEFDRASEEAEENSAAPETERMYVLWSMLPEVRETAPAARRPVSRRAAEKEPSGRTA
jgi:hypothetical protein